MQKANPAPKPSKRRDFSQIDFVEPYREFFTMMLADSVELRKEVFRLRYDVYCSELGWEDPSNHPDALEKDIYDDYSRHCLLMHKRTGLYAGTVRMVMTGDSDVDPKIPLVNHCKSTLYDENLHPNRQPPGTCGEISRLALRAEFRKRPTEQANPQGLGTNLFSWTPDEHRRFPHIALALYLGASAIGIADDAAGYAMMEPRLARHLRYAGLDFTQVGDPVDLRGQRAPYFISQRGLLERLSLPLRKLLLAIAEDLKLKIGA